jgi:CO/xanthine dehydrogenase FAD-binding subunit
VRSANEGDVSFATFIRAIDPALTTISVDGNRVTIGASVTMGRLIADERVKCLAKAAHAVGGPAIRNMATVGGNLYAPAPYGDLGVALLALDASVDIGGSLLPLAEFLTGRDTIHARSVLRSVSFDLPVEGALRFAKTARVKPKGVSIVTIAAVLAESGGVITSARVAYGCMADRPMRASAVEAALTGKPRTPDGIADALAVATEGTDPITDAIASAWYRAQVLPVHLGRLLLA